jgi:hypothetical protein
MQKRNADERHDQEDNQENRRCVVTCWPAKGAIHVTPHRKQRRCQSATLD